MHVTIWGSCAGPLLNRHGSRVELCLGSKGLGGALPPTMSQGGALLPTTSQGVGGPRRHSCVACLEALPKIPLPSKTQGKPSCCVPRDCGGSGQWGSGSVLPSSAPGQPAHPRLCWEGCWEKGSTERLTWHFQAAR